MTDQSDAGRDGVVEWTPELEAARIELCKFWLIIADDFGADSGRGARFLKVGRKALETEQALTLLGDIALRALVSAPSETVAENDTPASTFRSVLTNALWEYKKTIPRGTPFPQIIIDAENALWGWRMPSETVGRGELETEVEELRALVGRRMGGAEMQELMRLNNGLADKVRILTTLLDQQFGTPCEEIRHAQEVEKLQALALPTADRDAIREALKPFAAIAEADISDDETDADLYRPMSVGNNYAPLLRVGDLRRAIAALALIGEG